MINENMKKVLVALRSGEYSQAEGMLQCSDGHCCLGVMCEVYEKETGDKLPHGENGFLVGGDLDGQFFGKVKSWVGLKSYSGKFVGEKGGDNNSLVDMNDTLNKSFSEIADFIEGNPEGLFV
jgi:hypothetical protein|tara:strand:- start:345 stop:710 length:366 start_codon:yes stop_codon:yes gene_type:complete